MARLSVYVPDELLALVRAELPNVKPSTVLQTGLRAALACEHDELGCTACGQVLPRHAVTGPAMAAFFHAVMARLGERVDQAGYEGAARIVHRLAADHGIPGVIGRPLPRPSRAVLEARGDVVSISPESSRHRHPTNHQEAQPA